MLQSMGSQRVRNDSATEQPQHHTANESRMKTRIVLIHEAWPLQPRKVLFFTISPSVPFTGEEGAVEGKRTQKRNEFRNKKFQKITQASTYVQFPLILWMAVWGFIMPEYMRIKTSGPRCLSWRTLNARAHKSPLYHCLKIKGEIPEKPLKYSSYISIQVRSESLHKLNLHVLQRLLLSSNLATQDN